MKTIRIYSDESRHKNERFLLLGGLWIEEEFISDVLEDICAIRRKYGYKNDEGRHIDFLGELKWQKVSTRYFDVYRDVVDTFFSWIKEDKVRFCTMLIDTHDSVVLEYENIKKEGYFKLLYQLYLHNSKVPAIYKIFPDRITNPVQHKVSFTKLNQCLEAGLRKKFTPLLNPEILKEVSAFVNNITPMDSKKAQLLQVVDVIIGAVGFYQNRLFERPNARKAKVDLMTHILDKLLLAGTLKIIAKRYMIVKSTRFNVWLFRPSKQNK